MSPVGEAVDLVRRWVPSMLTLGALASGLSAIRFAQEGTFSHSVKFVMAAAVLDGLDGHVARFLGAVSLMGAELDSLCDLANFGVTPALVAFFWACRLPEDTCSSEGCDSERGLLWAACCFYASCCALRLARFNVAEKGAEMDKQHLISRSPSGRKFVTTVRRAWFHNVLQRKLYFQGIPAPVGAAYALAPMMLEFASSVGVSAVDRRRIAIWLVIVGILMVSTLPTLSSKMLKTDREDSVLRSRSCLSSLVKVTGSAALCAAAWLYPFDLFLLLVLGHVVSLPVGTFLFFCLATEDKKD